MYYLLALSMIIAERLVRYISAKVIELTWKLYLNPVNVRTLIIIFSFGQIKPGPFINLDHLQSLTIKTVTIFTISEHMQMSSKGGIDTLLCKNLVRYIAIAKFYINSVLNLLTIIIQSL